MIVCNSGEKIDLKYFTLILVLLMHMMETGDGESLQKYPALVINVHNMSLKASKLWFLIFLKEIMIISDCSKYAKYKNSDKQICY